MSYITLCGCANTMDGSLVMAGADAAVSIIFELGK